MYKFPSGNFLFVKSEVVGKWDRQTAHRVSEFWLGGKMEVNGRFIFDKSESVYAIGTTKHLFSGRKLYCLLLTVLELNFLYIAFATAFSIADRSM